MNDFYIFQMLRISLFKFNIFDENITMKINVFVLPIFLSIFVISSFIKYDTNPKWEGCYEYRIKCPNASSFKEIIKTKSSSDAKNRLKAKYPSCEINLSRTVECE